MGLTEELARLAELHARGELTDEEFDAAKRQVLVETDVQRSPVDEGVRAAPGGPQVSPDPTVNVAAALAKELNERDILHLEGDEDILAVEPFWSYIDWSFGSQHGDPRRTVGLRGPDGREYLVVRDEGQDRWRVKSGTDRHKTLLIIGAAVAVAVAFVVGLVLVIVLTGSHSKQVTVHGTFRISNGNVDFTNEFSELNYQSDGAGGCQGNSGYGDLNSITQVVVTDDKAKEVARTELGQGSVISEECIFNFSFNVKKGAKYYVVSVGRRGSSQYTFDQIQQPNAVALIIGNS